MSGGLTPKLTGGNDSLGGAGSDPPNLTYGQGQVAKPAAGLYGTWDTFKVAYLAKVAAGERGFNVIIDSSAGATVASTSLVVNETTPFQGRYQGSGDTLTVADGVTMQGLTTQDNLAIVSVSNSAVQTVGAATINYTLKGDASIKVTGTGDFILGNNAASLIQLNGYDAARLLTDTGYIGRVSVAGGSINVTNRSSATTVENNVFKGAASTLLNFDMFQTPQGAFNAQPNFAGTVSATARGQGDANNPVLLWKLDPNQPLLDQMDEVYNTSGATYSYAAFPVAPGRQSLKIHTTIAYGGAAPYKMAALMARCDLPASPARCVLTMFSGVPAAGQAELVFGYSDNTHYFSGRVDSGATTASGSCMNNGTYPNPSAAVGAAAYVNVGGINYIRQQITCEILRSTAGAPPQFIAERGAPAAGGTVAVAPAMWTSAFFTLGATWNIANGNRRGGIAAMEYSAVGVPTDNYFQDLAIWAIPG